MRLNENRFKYWCYLRHIVVKISVNHRCKMLPILMNESAEIVTLHVQESPKFHHSDDNCWV